MSDLFSTLKSNILFLFCGVQVMKGLVNGHSEIDGPEAEIYAVSKKQRNCLSNE